MTALAAEDAVFTSAPHSKGPPLTPDNISVKEFSGNRHPNNSFQPPSQPSTYHPVTFRVANPTVVDSDAYHHHDVRRPVDLAALREDIVHTFTTFSTFLETLTSFPAQTTPVPTTTTTTSASVVASHATDADDDHHHDHQHMVDLPPSRRKLCPTRALSVAKIEQTPPPNVPPQLTTTTTTPDTNDDDDRHDDRQRPVDLRALQREIHETMASIQSFFASLPILPVIIGRQNDQTSNPQPMTAPTTKPTTAIDAVRHRIEPCTLGAYLTQLHTPTCFVPACLLPPTGTGTSTIHSLLTRQPGQPTHTTIACASRPHQQQFTTIARLALPCTCYDNADPQPSLTNDFLNHPSQHLPYPATFLLRTAVSWFLIDRVLPSQLDRPPDQIYPIHMPLTPHPPQHGLPSPPNQTQFMDWQNLAVPHPVTRVMEKQDLRPP